MPHDPTQTAQILREALNQLGPQGPHIDAGQLLDWADDKLSPDEKERVEIHMIGCQECRLFGAEMRLQPNRAPVPLWVRLKIGVHHQKKKLGPALILIAGAAAAFPFVITRPPALAQHTLEENYGEQRVMGSEAPTEKKLLRANSPIRVTLRPQTQQEGATVYGLWIKNNQGTHEQTVPWRHSNQVGHLEIMARDIFGDKLDDCELIFIVTTEKQTETCLETQSNPNCQIFRRKVLYEP